MTPDEFLIHRDRYLETLQQQGKSQHTVSAYRRDLAQLAALLPEHRYEVSISDFVIVLKKLSQDNLSERSLKRKVSVWRQYGRYLVRRGLISTNPAGRLKAPKPPERLPKAVDAEPLNALFDRAAAESPLDIRDIAVFELLYGCGLRVSEACGLNVADILFSEGWVDVRGKGGKQRRVPLGRLAAAALRAYLPTRVAAAGENALFTNRFGRRISVRQIQYRLRDWAIKNGSPQHLSPHMLRHSYASHLLQSSGDIRAVQELLGHSSLSSTQIYTKLDFDHIVAVYDQTHPRAKTEK
ncbi:MAG: tyrosine-type recombinase/integrase [Neisseria sp.]|nr:tyrosine-type recombinase/integrase [Neisseria sp.]